MPARAGAEILRPIKTIAGIARRNTIPMNIAMRGHARKPIAAPRMHVKAGAAIFKVMQNTAGIARRIAPKSKRAQAFASRGNVNPISYHARMKPMMMAM